MKRNSIPLLAFLGLIFSIISQMCSAQDTARGDCVDISRVNLETRIGSICSSVYTEKHVSIADRFNTLAFRPGLQDRGAVPKNHVPKKIFLKFTACNSADTPVTVYFCPGFYFTEIRLYRVNGVIPERIPDRLPAVPDRKGFRALTLVAGDTSTIIAELSFLKTYTNVIRPRLVNPLHITAFTDSIHRHYQTSNLITFVFCGLMLMMILYSLSNFLQGAKREFLYYSVYALLLGGMLFLQSIMHLRYHAFSFFLESYLDFIMQGAGIIFYMFFMRRFLNTKEQHPFLYRLYNAGILILMGALALYTVFHYFTDNFPLENGVENSSKLFLLAMVIVFLVYSIRHWDDRLLRYLFWGNLFLFIFSMISQLGILLNDSFRKLPGIFSSTLLYYETGLFLELVFFFAGLNYKNRRQLIEQTRERESLKAQNLMQEYEKEIAVYKAQQDERARISADMHDELGAGMTAIRLMSEIARNKMKENTPVEIDKISQSANDVLNKMNAIIWSMNSGNDSLDNLVYYIRAYALEYFENTAVDCRFSSPEEIPAKEISGDKRRNLFLVVKESLNNVLKHSGATTVNIDITTGETLVIRISDNGKGIDLQNLRKFGNGLKNMKRRMESIGGSFHIENNRGVVTTLQLPM